MPLLELWSSNPQVIAQFSIQQIVNAAGSGTLQDGSDCSTELREYLRQVVTEQLAGYIETCLTSPFSNSGRVLQDLVNELGRRLDFSVTNGRYQGSVNAIGHDGLWLSPEDHAIVLEVKTTDAYRISLDTIAAYREKLINSGQISQTASSSVLLVVGREDTGELEAQVRGSTHAWDMRLISADALLKLVHLKEHAEEPQTDRKIRSLLVPREYTRLDEMVDVMFTTAKDVESAAGAEAPPDDEITERAVTKPTGSWEFTEPEVLQAKRQQMINALSAREGVPLIKKSRAIFWSPDHSVRAAFTVSKRYAKGSHAYWYAYHPQWRDFLAEGERGYVALGCVDRDEAFVIPATQFQSSVLDSLNITHKEDGKFYWHIHIYEDPAGVLSLNLPKTNNTFALHPFRIALTPIAPSS